MNHPDRENKPEPCPFCRMPETAFENLRDNDDDEPEKCWTIIHDCTVLCSTIIAHGDTEEQCVTRWNTRATQRPPVGDVESLISIWSMRPKPKTPEGEAWESGCRQGYEWGQQAALSQVEQKAGDGWLSMESAPKNGALILACGPEQRSGKPWWHSILGWSGKYWTDGTYADDEGTLVEFTPTHWMPLPLPPQGESHE